MEQSSDFCSDFQLKKCLYGRRLHLDRISSLPDDVLLFILSFLSFKEVVKTSLLSRRWLNLWVHTLVLDFHAPVTLRYLINDTERQNYVEWVNCILQQHKCQYLKEFKIVCHLDKPNEKDIDSWLVFAFARKVECLELNLLRRGRYPTNIRSNYVFPDRFLGFNSGEANSDGGRSRILQFDFKCLKSLSLMKVDVTGEAINFFLLNCPFLERLEVVGTLKLVNLVILDPTLVLKSLKIKLCCMLTVLRVSNFNLVSLEIPSVNDLTITNLPMLVELSIRGTSEKLSRSFSQASSCFSRLEALTFIGYYLKDATLLSNTDQLTKLKRLVINVRASSNESLTMFMSIISSCPQLEEFVLMLNWLGREQTGNNINRVERRGSSLKSKSLKVFEFFGYYGSDRNFELMMHVMENAVGLEKIIIDLTPRYACWTNRAKEARRSIALQQLDSVRESLPPHVHLLIRN